MTNNLTSVFRFSVMMALAIMISGVLPLLVQGYAWIDMANKAGGMEMLGTVIIEAEPCGICEVAQELNESSPSNGKNPFSSKNLDLLKGMTLATSELSANSISGEDLEEQFPIPSDFLCPAGQETSPATPPPRLVLAFS